MTSKPRKSKGVPNSPPKILPVAVMAGDIDSVKKAILGGEDVNSVESEHGFTPLILAVMRSDKTMADFLLSNGADPDKGFMQKITESDKALIKRARETGYVAESARKQTEDRILSGTLTEYLVSPIGIAMRKNDTEMVALLKKFGAIIQG